MHKEEQHIPVNMGQVHRCQKKNLKIVKDNNMNKIFEPLQQDFIDVRHQGFVEPKINIEKDYFFLGNTKIPDEIINKKGQYLDVIIEKEYQKKNGMESFGCTGFGTNNATEILLKYKYGVDWNGSDRGINILANNTPNGNNPQNPAEVLRKIGIFEESLLPFDNNIKTWKEFHSPKPLPQSLLKKCAEWHDEWDFLHEWVNTTPSRLVEALKRSPIGISVTAWKYRNGMYYKESGDRDNHWVVLIGYDYGKCWYIFDTYDSFVKKLEWNYRFQYAKRYYIKRKKQENNTINVTNDMLKTAKFQTDPRIFLVSNINDKDLLHIEDETTWNTFKKMGFISNEPDIVLPDTDYPKYEILPQNVKTPYKSNVLNAIKRIFGIK